LKAGERARPVVSRRVASCRVVSCRGDGVSGWCLGKLCQSCGA